MWVQTVYKDYQQTTKVVTNKERGYVFSDTAELLTTKEGDETTVN